MKNSIVMKQFYPTSPYLYQAGGAVYAQSLVPVESSFLQAMEAFDPNLQNDPFSWMPFGIMHDLRDDVIDPFFRVNDATSGFTIQKMFNALQSDVITPLQYRNKLMKQTNNRQQSEVNALFASYNIQ